MAFSYPPLLLFLKVSAVLLLLLLLPAVLLEGTRRCLLQESVDSCLGWAGLGSCSCCCCWWADE